MKFIRKTLAATAVAAMLTASTVAGAATPSAARLSLAGSPAIQDAAPAPAAADAETDGGNGSSTWINVGILAGLVGIVLATTGGDDSDSN